MNRGQFVHFSHRYYVDEKGTIEGAPSFKPEHLRANVMILMEQILKLKPQSAKGTYVRSVAVSATMSPGIAVAM